MWNEAGFLPYFLRHYSSFADKIVVWDEHSTDGTREIIEACPKAELRGWPHRGLDDEKFMDAFNRAYLEFRGEYDWIIFADCDEILWHPDMRKLLSETKADMLQAVGYGMITESGIPKFDGQIYDRIKTGIRQPNYDKYLLHRTGVDIVHQHGRHTYGMDWPKCSGVKAAPADLKLLHYHYFGVEHTAARNRRNFARAADKRFAWNYSSETEKDPKQVGTVAWVNDAILNKRLVDVFTGKPPLRKLHLGCGGHMIEGWENTDLPQVDIRKRLPYPDNSASHMFCEHCVEHVTHQEAWNFFEECYRVLAPGGVVRIAVPDMVKLSFKITDGYKSAVKAGGHGDGSRKAAIRAVVFEHGHRAVWSKALLEVFLVEIGFDAKPAAYGRSLHPELNDIEQHWKTVGRSVAECETSVVEGTKPDFPFQTPNP